MRLFLALRLPASLQARMAKVQEEIQGLHWELRLLPPEAGHLTLHFLGETPESLLTDLHLELSAFCHERRPFELSLGGLGCFPNPEAPRLLWLGVKDAKGWLAALREGTYRILKRYRHFKLEAPYTPHISLARIESLGTAWDPRLLERISKQWEKLGVLPVASLDLMESHLEASGARYELKESFTLKGSR